MAELPVNIGTLFGKLRYDSSLFWLSTQFLVTCIHLCVRHYLKLLKVLKLSYINFDHEHVSTENEYYILFVCPPISCPLPGRVQYSEDK